MQFPRQRSPPQKRINFSAIFNIKNTHARVLEKSEFGKTQIKKTKHPTTFFDQPDMPKKYAVTFFRWEFAELTRVGVSVKEFICIFMDPDYLTLNLIFLE